MILIAGLVIALATGAAQVPTVTDSTSISSFARLDSLYAARDTAGLVAAARPLSADSTRSARFYRGIAAAWSGKSRAAITLLRPLADSAVIPAERRRDLVRILSEHYARTRNYPEAAAMYERELAQTDSIASALRASVDSLDSAQKATPAPILETLTSPESPPPPEPAKIPGQLAFIALLFTLFLLPKALQRFRIPGAITSLILGAIATQLGLFPHDATLSLLSTLGIVALFLFAGLEIDGRELRDNARALSLHGLIWTALAVVTAAVVMIILDVPVRVAALLSLALVTPSTGFILSSLSQFGLSASEQKSVRTYAVGSEIIALGALFFVLQATSIRHLSLAIAAMIGIVLVIPIAFRGFASVVAPHAPKSEFAFLLMVAIVCAYATRLLGVYYLVGAFLVGVAAQRYRSSHPAMTSEKMIDALESFGSVFIPFYFFHAGMGIVSEHLTLRSALIGIVLVVVVVPIRVAVVSLHRRRVLKESFALSLRPASAMIPTLVFTLVLVEILESRFGLSSAIAGGLVLYTVVNTAIPGFVLRGKPADFEDVEALPLEEIQREG
jgi:Kef-type K+ transport system membrane component KefB